MAACARMERAVTFLTRGRLWRGADHGRVFVVAGDAAGLLEEIVERDFGGDILELEADITFAKFVFWISDQEVRAEGGLGIGLLALFIDHVLESFERFGKRDVVHADHWELDGGELSTASFGNQVALGCRESPELVAGVGVIGFQAQRFVECDAGTGDVAFGHGIHAFLIVVIGFTTKSWQGDHAEGGENNGALHGSYFGCCCLGMLRQSRDLSYS